MSDSVRVRPEVRAAAAKAARAGGSGGGQGCTAGAPPSEGGCLDEASGVFVRRDGDDAAPGTREQPVATIGRAIEIAAEAGLAVFACDEVFDEHLVVPAGGRLYGGLDCEGGWTWNGVDTSRTVVAPQSDTGEPVVGVLDSGRRRSRGRRRRQRRHGRRGPARGPRQVGGQGACNGGACSCDGGGGGDGGAGGPGGGGAGGHSLGIAYVGPVPLQQGAGSASVGRAGSGGLGAGGQVNAGSDGLSQIMLAFP